MHNNTVYQLSTAFELISGKAEGKETLNEVMKFGDFGLGAINDYNGELILYHESAFAANFHGKIQKLNQTETCPFAIISSFYPETEFELQKTNKENAFKQIAKRFKSSDLIYAIKIHGHFESIVLRSGKKQSKPYPDFNTILKNTNTYIVENKTGTMIGYYFPESYEKISTHGFHFHFIDDKKKIGGHVCDFNTTNATVYINEKINLSIMLPKPES